jgi:hypothetical protein
MNTGLLSSVSDALLCAAGQRNTVQKLHYAPPPVDNPLKGLVPYAGERHSLFPHSLEFNYLPLGSLVVGKEKYDWKPLEALLNDISSRGCQAVFRIWMEYPGKTGGIPRYLLEGGLKVHRYLNTNTQPLPPAQVETPDYEDRSLRAMLTGFITEMGRRYDGDPRIGFITAGLLGTWGEWHTYPRSELFAGRAVQIEVMDAYERAFRTTPVLLRYPAGKDHSSIADNSARRMGYHDDSFAWATLETSRPQDGWFFMAAMRAAGRGAMDRWKTQPIGGEIRPEAWGKVFDADPGTKEIQDFRRCVDATHASWLMDSGMFSRNQQPQRRQRAEAEVRHMGYDLSISEVQITRDVDKLRITATVENRGVAPFYYPWPVLLETINSEGAVMRSVRMEADLRKILPGRPEIWTAETALIPPGAALGIRIPNPMPGGRPLVLSNTGQDVRVLGRLMLMQRDLPGGRSVCVG